MPSTFKEMKRNVEKDGWEVIWTDSYGWGDVAIIAACAYFGCLQLYFKDRLNSLIAKVGTDFLEQVIRNKGKVVTSGNLEAEAGTAYWSVYHTFWNPFAGRKEKLTTERFVRLYIRYRTTPSVQDGEIDVLPRKTIASGKWGSIRENHQLIPMGDGRVLDWVPTNGEWRLWVYDPKSVKDIFPGESRASGKWASIREGHQLIPMGDGRVLDWVPINGKWKLWNYDSASTGDVLPGRPHASGQWAGIREGHQLVPMGDGRVLDWTPNNGEWKLWNYSPDNTTDIFPGSPHASGKWSGIRKGHQLITMDDGRVLDWVPSTGDFKLWNYDAGNTDDVLPGKEIASGNWDTIRTGKQLIKMVDGKVLDWKPTDGTWQLWKYSAYG